MKDQLRRGLAMLMSVVMTLSLFVGYLPTEAYAENIVSSGGFQAPMAALAASGKEIQMSISVPGDDTLKHIGDTRQLGVEGFKVEKWRKFDDYTSYSTEWTLVEGGEYVTLENGLVTAKNFYPGWADTGEHSVKISAVTTFYKYGRVVGTGTADVKLKVQFSTYEVYCYTPVPNVTEGGNNEKWYSLSVDDNFAVIWGAPQPTSSGRSLSSSEYVLVSQPSSFPTLTIGGKDYVYDREEYGYTVTPSAVVDSYGANPGKNGGPEVEKDPTYHLDYSMSYTGEKPNEDTLKVEFWIQRPGETGFVPVPNKQCDYKKGTAVSEIAFPSFENSEYGGLTYTFDGWYPDSKCEAKVNEKSSKEITADTIYYGRYTTNEGLVKIEYYYDNVISASVTKPFAQKAEQGAKINLKDYIVKGRLDGFSFSRTEPAVDEQQTCQVDITAGETTTIKIFYVSQCSVSYTIKNAPSGVTASWTERYDIGDSVPVAGAPEVSGWQFQGWKLTSHNLTPEKDTYRPGDAFTMPDTAVTFEGEYAREYTVTYKVDDLQVGETENYCAGDQVTLRTEVPEAKDGYQFSGWVSISTPDSATPVVQQDGKFTMPASNVTIIGRYDPTVKYVDGNGTALSSPQEKAYKPGETVTVANGPDKEGYTFVGWNTENTLDESGKTQYQAGEKFTMPDKSVVFTAVYSDKTYQVKYVIEGKIPTGGSKETPSEQYNNGKQFQLWTPAVPDDYVFKGWWIPSEGEDEIHMPGGYETINGQDLNFHGRYEEKSQKLYTVTYMADGEQVDNNSHCKYSDLFPVTKAGPEKTGYNFTGWLSSADNQIYQQGGLFYMPAEDVTLTAQYEIKTHNVSYEITQPNPTGVTVPENYQKTNVDFGTTLTVEDALAATGYTFSGWTAPDGLTVTEENGVKRFTMPDEDVVFTGSFTINSYTLKYLDENGNSISGYVDETYNYQAPVSVKNEPNKPGYMFDGWVLLDDKGQETDTRYQAGVSFDMPADDVTLKAKYTARNDIGYTVEYYLEAPTGGYPTTASESESFSDGTMGQTVSVLGTNGEPAEAYALNQTGFSYDKGAENETSGAIDVDSNGDGTLVLKLYYKRDVFRVTYVDEAGQPIEGIGPEDHRYGERVTASESYPRKFWNAIDPATNQPIEDLFVGWETDNVSGTRETYGPGAWFIMPGNNVQLKAVYTSDPGPARYTVRYEILSEVKPEGTEATREIKYAAKDSFTLWDPGEVEGYRFVGWWKAEAADHTSTYERGSNYTMARGNVTFQGRYVKISKPEVELVPYTVEYYLEKLNGYNNWVDQLIDEMTVTEYGEAGSAVDAKTAGYDVAIPGYTFVEGKSTLTGTIAKDSQLTLKLYYSANDDTGYKIVYHLQELPKSANPEEKLGYNPVNEDTQVRPGKTGDWVELKKEDVKAYTGFELNTDHSPAIGKSQQIQGDGGMVFDLYYDRITYKVTYQIEGATEGLADGETLPKEEQFRFGAPVTAAGAAQCKTGYAFRGWYTKGANGEKTPVTSPFPMPAEDVTLYGEITEVTARYTIEYYWLSETSGEYEPAGTDNTKEPVQVGTSVTIRDEDKTPYPGYIVDHIDPANGTITIQEDSTQNVIKVYLKMAEYNVSYDVELPAGVSAKPALPTEDSKNWFESFIVGFEPTISGYRFAGWETNDGKTTNNGKALFQPGDNFIMPTNDVNFVGKYEPLRIGYTVKHYLVGTKTEVPVTSSAPTETYDFGTTHEIDLTAFAVPQGYERETTSANVTISSTNPAENVVEIYYYKLATVTAENASKIYGDKDPNPFRATVDGTLSGETINYTVSREEGEDVGPYMITPTGDEIQDYYKVSYQTGTFTIMPCIVTIETKGYNDVYDGEAHSAEVVVKVGDQVRNDIALEYDIYDGKEDGWMDKAPSVKDVTNGDLRVVVRPKGNNYKLAGNDPAYGFTLTVTPRPVTLTSESAKKVYDGTPLTANSQTDVTVSGRGFVKDEGVERYSFNATASQTDVGKNENGFIYTLKGNTSAGNYTITVEPGKLEVTKRPITLLGESREAEYDGTEKQLVTFKVDTSENKYDLVAGDTITGQWYEAKGTNAGSYDGVFTGTAKVMAGAKDVTENYEITTIPGKLTITESKALTIAAEDYKAMYDGAAHGGKITVTGAPTADVTFVYSVDGGTTWTNVAPEIKDVGTKNVQVKASCLNYADATAAYTLAVYQREIAVKGIGKTVTYDGTEQHADGFALELVSAGNGGALISGHKINITGFEAKGTYAGEYTGVFSYANGETAVKIEDGGEDVTQNYKITETPAKLIIQPREITIKPVNVTATYDGQEHKATAFEYVDGSLELVEGDTLNVSYSDGITNAGTKVSSLTATESSTRTTGGNYRIYTETGTVTVMQRPLILTGSEGAVTFNGQTQRAEGFTVGASGLVSGQQLSGVTYTAEGRNAGMYKGQFTGTPVIMSGSEDVTSNYTISTDVKTLTISPARLTVRTESANKVYDGEPLTNGRVTLTLEGQTQTVETVPGRAGTVRLPNGETIGITVTGTQTEADSTANTATIHWNGSSSGSFTANEENYTISSEYGRLTVTDSEDEIVVTTTGGVFVYDGLPHAATVTVSELPEGYTLARAASSAVAQTVLDGTVEAVCDELVIRNAQGEDVTEELNIRYVNSTLIIERAPLYITTLSATKEYDGEPLTAGVTVTGLVNGETVSVMPTGSQTEIGSSQNGYHVAWVGTAKVYNYEIEETLGTLTVTPVGELPAPQAQNADDDPPEVRVVDTMLLEDEIVPLAGNTEKCCILHFLLALAALATVVISGHDTKKLQERIAELKKKETPEDGADDSRTNGGKDDN